MNNSPDYDLDSQSGASLKEEIENQAEILSEGHQINYKLDPILNRQENHVYFFDEKMTEIAATQRLLALVIDIGTTTVIVSVVDVETGLEVGVASDLNPQRTYGQDVFTRISYIQENPNKLEKLKADIVGVIERLALELSKEYQFTPEEIFGMIVTANPTMNHIFSLHSPVSLGKAPYHMAFEGYLEIPFSELGFTIFGKGLVAVLPNISAFVGGDLTAGILATGINEAEGNTLLVDIGTNGEMILNKAGVLYSTSCAAGPALEGMGIHHGQTAQVGAIEEAYYEEGKLHLQTIGHADATGICGSGILALIREYLKANLIIHRGNIQKIDQLNEADKVFIGSDNKSLHVSKNRGITLSQHDIRQVQLAKGAILTGVTCLLQASDLNATEIDKVYIAGQFGKHLSESSLIDVGLLPKEFTGKIIYAGNSSKSGGQIALLSKEHYKLLIDLTPKIKHLELSTYSGFERIFAHACRFPRKNG